MNPVTFSTTITHFISSPLWGYYFPVSNEIASLFINGNNRRVICTLNDTISLHCALMPNKENWFVMLNKQVFKKLNLPLNSVIEVKMIKDESEYGMPMPDEFREVLDQDPDADVYFHNLTPGKQRSLIYLVGKVKSSDSRIRKALAIADHLTANKGNIDYKLLNEAFKAYNNLM